MMKFIYLIYLNKPELTLISGKQSLLKINNKQKINNNNKIDKLELNVFSI